MLELQDIQQHYGSSHTLRNLSITAHPGEVTAILGRNGVGKTTLLRAIMGIVPLTSGSIRWEGKDISRLSPEARVALGFGYVPQGREIFPRLTVEENLKMGMAKLSGRAAKTIPGELFEMFPVLSDMRHRKGGDLSGGQQQQLAIARALAGKPRILLLDEPTEGIQPNIIKLIGTVIAQLASRGDMAVVLVEQFYDFAEKLASRYAVLGRGEVVDSGLGSEMAAKNVKDRISV
ncbi:MAG: urea ABC transporter ATP-binding subunit UrtE [Fibrobacterota bacterium]|nr:urea ABC transporter ATP-binding subunit UrtE [Fibrobacterota bacterium]QQS03143.1 MAG: urea ABC transporter ATP-binding subunit UrtE [Fibrobacterota bacterium]